MAREERQHVHFEPLAHTVAVIAVVHLDRMRHVQTRERIVLPLTTIQQYALTQIRETDDEELKNTLEKLVIRCSFGIINAGRNSA